MSGLMFGADAEELEQIALELEGYEDELGHLLSQGVGSVALLGLSATLNSIWAGPRASEFGGLWQSRHLLRIRDVQSMLREAAADLRRNAEEQRRTSSIGGGAGATRGPVASTAAPTNDGQPADDEAAPMPSSLANAMGSNAVFEEDYMSDFIGTIVPVTDEARLNELMESLLLDDLSVEETNAALDEMAALRGEDPAEFRAQYEQYEILATEAEQNAGKTPDDIDVLAHPDFVGSVVSLRYGKVVGDALGIDPVFGAMLNPSGGLVGPGNQSYLPGENDAVGYHGTFHDAAGYLLVYQEQGPGYDYLGREPLLGRRWPGTGQATGISWWVGNHPTLDVDMSEVRALAGDGMIVNLAIDQVNPEALHRLGFEEVVGQRLLVHESRVRTVDGLATIISGDASGFSEIGGAASDFAVGTADNIWDVGVKQAENFVDAGSAAVDGAEYLGGAAVDGAEYLGGAAVDGAEALGGAAVDGAEALGGAAVDFAESVGGGLRGMWP